MCITNISNIIYRVIVYFCAMLRVIELLSSGIVLDIRGHLYNGLIFHFTANNLKMLIDMHEDDMHMVGFCQRSCVVVVAMRHSLGNSNIDYLSCLGFSVGTYFLGKWTGHFEKK